MPEPDYLFVALGSLGTGAGLYLGCALAGLKTRVIGVSVAGKRTCIPEKWAAMINKTGRYMQGIDTGIPQIKASSAALTVLDDYLGERYAQFTREGMQAISLIHSLENIKLDGTYTGKALAGTLDYIKMNRLEDKVLLFWNTYNSADLSHLIKDMDYLELPKPFHSYFTSPNQELDQTYMSPFTLAP